MAVCEEVSAESGVSVSEMLANTMNERKPSAARREAQRRMLATVPGMNLGLVAEFFGRSRRRVRRSVLFGPDAGTVPLEELTYQSFMARGFEWTLAGVDCGQLGAMLSSSLALLVQKVREMDAPGSLRLRVQLSPGRGDQVTMSVVVDMDLPHRTSQDTLKV